MAAPSTPVYILPGSTLEQETIDRLLNTFHTMSALEAIGVPPNLLAFHTVPATTHQCSSPVQIAEYHVQNKRAVVSVKPVIVLDDQSEGEGGTVLVVGFPKEKDEVSLSDDEEEPAQTSDPHNTEAQAQPYPSVRVVPTVSTIISILLPQAVNFRLVGQPIGRESFNWTPRSESGESLE